MRAFTLSTFALTFLLAAPTGVVAETNATASSSHNDTGYDPNVYANATLWTLSGDYAHFFSSSLGGFDYYGGTGTLKWPLDPDLALHFEGGYHHVTFTGGDANDFTAGSSLVFERQGWHFGP